MQHAIPCPVCGTSSPPTVDACPNCAQPNPADLVVRMLRKQLALSKIDAIKRIRELLPRMGLAEAKSVIDTIESGSKPFPDSYGALLAMAEEAGHVITAEQALPHHSPSTGSLGREPEPKAVKQSQGICTIHLFLLDSEGLRINNREVTPLPVLSDLMQIVGPLERTKIGDYGAPGVYAIPGDLILGRSVCVLTIRPEDLPEPPVILIDGTAIPENFSLSQLLQASRDIKWEVGADGRSAILATPQLPDSTLEIRFGQDQIVYSINLKKKIGFIRKSLGSFFG